MLLPALVAVKPQSLLLEFSATMAAEGRKAMKAAGGRKAMKAAGDRKAMKAPGRNAMKAPGRNAMKAMKAGRKPMKATRTQIKVARKIAKHVLETKTFHQSAMHKGPKGGVWVLTGISQHWTQIKGPKKK